MHHITSRIFLVILVAFCACHGLAISDTQSPDNVELNWMPVPEPLYDEYLGDRKDNIESLKSMIFRGLDAPDGGSPASPNIERFRAYLAVRRLGTLPPKDALKAMPELLGYVGVRYKPTGYWGLWNPSAYQNLRIESEEYPSDEAIIKLGKDATGELLKVWNTDSPDRPFWEHCAEILAAIEGRQRAQELLCDKFAASKQDFQRENIMTSIATLRARAGLPLSAETPKDKYEQELKRVKEELGSKKYKQGQPNEPLEEDQHTVKHAAPGWSDGVPWLVIIIGVAVVAIGLGILLLRNRKK